MGFTVWVPTGFTTLQSRGACVHELTAYRVGCPWVSRLGAHRFHCHQRQRCLHPQVHHLQGAYGFHRLGADKLTTYRAGCLMWLMQLVRGHIQSLMLPVEPHLPLHRHHSRLWCLFMLSVSLISINWLSFSSPWAPVGFPGGPTGLPLAVRDLGVPMGSLWGAHGLHAWVGRP